MPKAVICEKFGPPSTLTVQDVPAKQVQANGVKVQVHAAAINFPDTLIIQNKYQFKPRLPFSPGGEAAGIITEVGKNVKNFKIGDKVVASTGWGAFQEEILINPARLTPLPDAMDPIVASGFILAYGTSYYALKYRAQLKPGETVLVLGAAGGVGITAVELAKLMGATVIAAASSDDKLETCKSYGADMLINYSKVKNFKKQIKKLTKGRGVDVVYDPVGGPIAEQAVRSMGWKGRYLIVGFVAGIPKIPLNLYLLKGCSAVGVFYGRWFSENPQEYLKHLDVLMKWYIEGKLNPLITKCLPLERVAEGLELLLQRKAKGKIILTTQAGRDYQRKSKL